MKEEITVQGQLCAIIIYNSFRKTGIHFFTPSNLSQQLAAMSYPPGKIIEAHTHNPVHREVYNTQEALFIRKGKIRVDFYTQDRQYQMSRILSDGDVILLISGGHGFEVLEEVDMIEVKQGPYAGDMDKTRFEPEQPTERNYA